MIAFVAAAALAATAPNGNTFEAPPGWSDGPPFRSGEVVVLAGLDPAACALLAQRAMGSGAVAWATPTPWLGWSAPDGVHQACVDVPGGALLVEVPSVQGPPLFNRLAPLLAPMRAAMEVDPVTTSGTPSSATSDDDAVPVIGGMGLFATLGEEAPAGGGFVLHFSAPSLTTGPFVGLDFGLGAAGGFLYEVDLHLGFAWTPGPVRSALYSGIGADGVTSRVRGSAAAPLGAVVFAPILPRWMVELGGEARWYTAGRRADPEGVFGFDEVEAYAGLWFARQVPPGTDDPPKGLWLGGSWKETPDGWVARVVVGTGEVASR